MSVSPTQEFIDRRSHYIDKIRAMDKDITSTMQHSRDHQHVAKLIDELFKEIASYVELLQSRLIQIDSESSEGADIKVRLVELRALQTERESEFLHYQRDCQRYGLPWSAPHESLPQTP